MAPALFLSFVASTSAVVQAQKKNYSIWKLRISRLFSAIWTQCRVALARGISLLNTALERLSAWCFASGIATIRFFFMHFGKVIDRLAPPVLRLMIFGCTFWDFVSDMFHDFDLRELVREFCEAFRHGRLSYEF